MWPEVPRTRFWLKNRSTKKKKTSCFMVETFDRPCSIQWHTTLIRHRRLEESERARFLEIFQNNVSSTLSCYFFFLGSHNRALAYTAPEEKGAGKFIDLGKIFHCRHTFVHALAIGVAPYALESKQYGITNGFRQEARQCISGWDIDSVIFSSAGRIVFFWPKSVTIFWANRARFHWKIDNNVHNRGGGGSTARGCLV